MKNTGESGVLPRGRRVTRRVQGRGMCESWFVCVCGCEYMKL